MSQKLSHCCTQCTQRTCTSNGRRPRTVNKWTGPRNLVVGPVGRSTGLPPTCTQHLGNFGDISAKWLAASATVGVVQQSLGFVTCCLPEVMGGGAAGSKAGAGNAAGLALHDLKICRLLFVARVAFWIWMTRSQVIAGVWQRTSA